MKIKYGSTMEECRRTFEMVSNSLLSVNEFYKRLKKMTKIEKKPPSKPHYHPTCKQLVNLAQWMRNTGVYLSDDEVTTRLRYVIIFGKPIVALRHG